MTYKWIFLSLLFLFLINTTSADLVKFNCPARVNSGEEFTCSLNININQINELWDVKVDLSKDGKSIARVWNGEKNSFVSAYYYLKSFIKSGETKDIRLIINQTGKFEGKLKLREPNSSKIEYYNFSIEVLTNTSSLKEDVGKLSDNPIKPKINQNNLSIDKNKSDETTKKKIILLNNQTEYNSNGEIVYESKNEKILRYLPYAFSLFLIIIIVVLLREKF